MRRPAGRSAPSPRRKRGQASRNGRLNARSGRGSSRGRRPCAAHHAPNADSIWPWARQDTVVSMSAVARRRAAYGAWASPITIEMAVSSSVALREPRLDGDDVYWTEGRPGESGRQVIVRWNERDGAIDVTPPPFNARTSAHEYGGGWYAVDRGTVYFVNFADGRIYRQERGSAPVPITKEGPYQHGDLVVDRAHNRLLCVREDMSDVLAHAGHAPSEGERGREPRDLLIAVDLATLVVETLASGYDFYSTPRASEDGSRLAWISWRHPNMPWDGTELWVADVDADGRVHESRRVAGGPDESIV